MNRLFVNFTQYSHGQEDNYTHCFVGTLHKTIQLGDRITPASRRRIEKLVQDAPKLGLEVSLRISNLSMWVVIYRGS